MPEAPSKITEKDILQYILSIALVLKVRPAGQWLPAESFLAARNDIHNYVSYKKKLKKSYFYFYYYHINLK